MLPRYATAVTTPPAGDRAVLFIALFVKHFARAQANQGGRSGRQFGFSRVGVRRLFQTYSCENRAYLVENKGRYAGLIFILCCGSPRAMSYSYENRAYLVENKGRYAGLIFILRCGSPRAMSYS